MLLLLLLLLLLIIIIYLFILNYNAYCSDVYWVEADLSNIVIKVALDGNNTIISMADVDIVLDNPRAVKIRGQECMWYFFESFSIIRYTCTRFGITDC